MSMHAAPRAPRRRSSKPSHPTIAILFFVLLVLSLASQCGSEAETSDSAPTITVPSTTPAAPLVEAPQPAGNETADADPTAPAGSPEPESPPVPLRAPAPAPVPTWTPAPAVDNADTDSADNGGSAYYKNCAAARAAGVTPLYAGDPGYSSKLDRDGDGVACE